MNTGECGPVVLWRQSARFGFMLGSAISLNAGLCSVIITSQEIGMESRTLPSDLDFVVSVF